MLARRIAIVAALAVVGGNADDQAGSIRLEDNGPYTVRIYPVADLLARPEGGSAAASRPALEEARRLIGLVRTVVRPESWGDPRARIAEKPAGSLTISQTAAGHAAVKRLFGSLRAHHATRIKVRTHFLAYHHDETVSLISSTMRLDQKDAARLVLTPEETMKLLQSLTRRPDVTVLPAPTLTLASGGQARASIGTETILRSDWRLSADAPHVPDQPPLRVSAFEGSTLLVGATASPDGRSVTLQVTGTATLLAGGRVVSDAWGRIDLPEFSSTRVRMTARVPSGHALLVGGLRTKIEEKGTSEALPQPLRRRRDANVLMVLIPTVEAPRGPSNPPEGGREGAATELESLALLARMRRWAPSVGTASRPAGTVHLGRVTVSSPDGLVTLELNLAEGDVRTPTVKEWLRRLLNRPGVRVDDSTGEAARD